MYLRHTTRRKDGKVRRYWQLVRSVRVRRKVVQQTVAHLGELDAQGRARAKALAGAITGDRDQPDLFIGDDGDKLSTTSLFWATSPIPVPGYGNQSFGRLKPGLRWNHDRS